MRLVKIVTVVTAFAGVVLATPVASAPKPHIVDVAGDATTREAGYDIRSVTFSTLKKSGKPYALQIRMTLEQAPPRTVAHHYTVEGWVDTDCRFVAFANQNETEYAGWQLFCAGREPLYRNLPTEVHGKDLVWTFPFTQVVKPVRPGMVITDLSASTGVQEVWFGSTLATIDYASSAASYRI